MLIKGPKFQIKSYESFKVNDEIEFGRRLGGQTPTEPTQLPLHLSQYRPKKYERDRMVRWRTNEGVVVRQDREVHGDI